MTMIIRWIEARYAKHVLNYKYRIFYIRNLSYPIYYVVGVRFLHVAQEK